MTLITRRDFIAIGAAAAVLAALQRHGAQAMARNAYVTIALRSSR